MVTDKQRKIVGAVGGLLAIVLIAGAIVVVFGILDDPPGRIRTGDAGQTPIGAGLQEDYDAVIDENAELSENFEKFVGKKVIARGRITSTQTADARTIVLDTDGLIGNDEILVIRKGAAWQGRLDKGTVIDIAGRVSRMDSTSLAGFNREMGLDLSDEQIRDFDQQLILVADEISIPAH